MVGAGPSAIGRQGIKTWCAVFVSLLCALAWRDAGAQASASVLLRPSALAYDSAGNLYIADANRQQVLEATLAGTVVVVAGTGAQGFSGDGGPAAQAQLSSPQGLAFGADGTLYIADTGNARIRAVSGGTISTFAGSGVSSFSGDGGAASAASFRSPSALAVDGSGALLVCDTPDHRVRRISAGVVSTFAGDGVQGFAGDGGGASLAELDSPAGIALAPDGRVFIADTHNHRVRVVATDGTISTFAGTGERGFAGDGGAAAVAQLAGPRGLAVAPDGGLLIADVDDQRIRKISSAAVISTVAGDGAEGTSAEGATALNAALHAPRALALSPFGLPVLADTLNGAVRVLTADGALWQPAAFMDGRTSVVQPAWSASQVYGQVTASIAVNGAIGLPQGSVTLVEGGTTLANAVLSGGKASFVVPALGAGDHTITAVYAGDGLNPAASASGGVLSVAPAQVTASAHAVNVTYGAPLPALTGTLTGVLPQDAGQVSVVFSAGMSNVAGVGTYPITASLTGARSANYALSMAAGSGSLQIVQAGSTVALGALSGSYEGLPVRLTATVGSRTSGQPTGTVRFLDGGAVVATAMVVNGSASAVYVSPPAGTRSLSAQYSGDANFQASTSVVQQAVIGSLPDFGLTPAGAATATVAAGSTATYTVQVSAQPSPFTGVVVLSAAGLPAGATVSFSPVQVVPGVNSATVAVSIQTPVPQALLREAPGTTTGILWAGVAIGLLGCWRKSRRKMLWLLGMGLWLCGCGARTVSEGSGGVTSQSYAVQITGTSTNLVGSVVTHSTALTLVVQQ